MDKTTAELQKKVQAEVDQFKLVQKGNFESRFGELVRLSDICLRFPIYC